MKICLYCRSKRLKKLGFYKTKRGQHQRFKCLQCDKTFSNKTFTPNWRKRKQHYRSKITTMYCERMSLRGIARTLNIDIKTVVNYFKENSQIAYIKTNKRIEDNELVTSYVQFDQIETFEHTKKRPVGIQVSIRHRTGEIISAKVGYIPIRSLTVSKTYSQSWNKKVRESNHTFDMFWQTKKVLNKKSSLISCDNERRQVNLLKRLYDEPFITLAPTSKQNKRIDRVFRRMRQDISRLGRKTLSTTKKIENLQRHLDLYIDYNNLIRIA